MKVGWLQDDPGYLGGAEMTAAEFKAAAPVEVVDCLPGAIDYSLDTYVAQNIVTYSFEEIQALQGKRLIKYCHDVWPHGDPRIKTWWVEHGELIFCSPIQRERMGLEGQCIPPALDLDRMKVPKPSAKRRSGACSIAQWRNPGKGAQYIDEYAATNGPVDVYGPGPFQPRGLGVNYLGDLEPDKVAQTLWKYERFVFLPFELEPFCRTAVEAYYAGCKLTVNNLIGARHYLENDPEALQTAAEDFWNAVLAEVPA